MRTVTGQTTLVDRSAEGQVADNSADFATQERQETDGIDTGLGYRWLIERYAEGKSHLMLRIRSRKGCEFLACIQRESGGRDANHPVWNREEFERGILADTGKRRIEFLSLLWGHCASHGAVTRGQWKSMFVYDVEFVELPERMAKPSLVWLNTPEDLQARLPRALYTSQQRGVETLGGISNWELRVLDSSLALGSDNRMDQVIKRAMQVMDSVAHDKPDLDGDDGDALEVINYVASLFIGLSTDMIAIRVPEGIDGFPEILDVLAGPVVFC